MRHRMFSAFLLVLATGTSQANCTLEAANVAATPDSRFSAGPPGTVIDQRGLMWRTTLSATAVNWRNAIALANADTTGGFTDWRLPTLEELASIVETGCSNPAINTSFFMQSTGSTAVWTGTDMPDAGTAWYVGFTTGFDEVDHKNATKGVRLVRTHSLSLFADGFE